MKPFLVVPTLATLAAAVALAADKPIQLAFLPPDGQLVSEDQSIHGFRLDFYGRNKDMRGLDFGLVHETTGEFSGVAIGLANLVDGSASGLQWSLVGYGETGGDANGWVFAGASNVRGSVQGLQQGLVTLAGKDFDGAQLGVLWNQTDATVNGVQLGVVNKAGKLSGLQIGLVNLADDANGLQIGLINRIHQSPSHGLLPIVNWKF